MPSFLPPCTKCGACCIAEDEAPYHAELSSNEVERGVFSPRGRYRRYVVSTGGDHFALATKWRPVRSGPLKSYEVCACVLLRGNPLVQVACALYPDRPEVCRAFRRGGETCRDALRWLETQAGLG